MRNRCVQNCILMVDDDQINNFINLKLFRKLNIAHELKTALNGDEALRHINEYCVSGKGCCPWLIFLDINMPVMNGFEFIEAYQKLSFENKEKIRIIILTTSSNPKDMAKIKELGINEFMNKPLTEEKVKALI